MSISGAQMKLSIHINKHAWEVEAVAEGGTHILKPVPNQYPGLPENESLCMNIAAILNMNVPPHGLFPMSDKSLCYIVKRFDRTDDGRKLHKETVFQIMGADDKYSGSIEQIGKIVRRHVANVGLELIDLFERVLLCFLIGNGDMHLKNWALLLSDKGEYGLAPCYDLVSSKMYLPEEEDSALAINGRKNLLRRSDFMSLAQSLRIEDRAARNSVERLVSASDDFMELAEHSQLSEPMVEQFREITLSRFQRISQT